MKIYDGFTFFNELDLLEIRLEELYEHVDKFILVESDHTFTNIPKPYYFEENKERYSKYLDKIIHIKINSSKHENPWDNETVQRDAILQGCIDADSNDLLIMSDVDEIPRNNIIDFTRTSDNDIFSLCIPFFFFKFNFLSTLNECYYPNIIIARMKIAKELGTQTIRNKRLFLADSSNEYYSNYSRQTFNHAGWHFTYLGDTEHLRKKFVSYSHAIDLPQGWAERYQLEDELYDGFGSRYFVKFDDYFPKTVTRNIEKYQQYIVNGDFPRVVECFYEKNKGYGGIEAKYPKMINTQ